MFWGKKQEEVKPVIEKPINYDEDFRKPLYDFGMHLYDSKINIKQFIQFFNRWNEISSEWYNDCIKYSIQSDRTLYHIHYQLLDMMKIYNKEQEYIDRIADTLVAKLNEQEKKQYIISHTIEPEYD